MVRWEGNIYDWDIELTVTWFRQTESNEISDILETMTDIHLGSLARKGFIYGSLILSYYMTHTV